MVSLRNRFVVRDVAAAHNVTAVDLHLAQFNIATLRHPMDHPETASFVALLDDVNRLAESSPGFVWRHGIDSRNVDDPPVYDNPLTLVNASVWESLGALRDFAYKGLHRDVFRRRGDWFVSSEAVMWWLPAGTLPTLAECTARVEFLPRHGPSPYAFETGQRFPQLVVIPRLADHPDVATMLARSDRDRLHDDAAFYIAYVDGAPCACGAYHRIDGADGAAELQHLWADPMLPDLQLGAAVLATLETAARAGGCREVRLAT